MLNETTSAYQTQLTRLKELAVAEKTQQFLSMKFIMGINDALVEFCAPRFKEITQESRKNRRAVRAPEKLDVYQNEVMQSTMLIEKMLIDNMTQVCDQCGVSIDKYEQSNAYWAQINPQFALLAMLM